MGNPDRDKTGCSSNILITGGSGLIGRYLTSLLLSEGYRVSHLSRSATPVKGVNVFKWDPEKKIIDPSAFNGINYIIHLAGTNIGEKRWTKSRKKEIVSSRVDSSLFLFENIKESRVEIKAFISASAIGIYGSATSEKIFEESDPPSADFLGTTCRLWEEAADMFRSSGIRTVKIRTAVVLEKNDSALAKLLKPALFGFIFRLGNGHQYMPWIHIDDICRIYLKSVKDDKMEGAYNAVAPHHTDNKNFMKALAKVIRKPVFLPPVPSILIRSVMGGRASIVLEGSRISCEKILSAGYSFIYPDLESALKNAISGRN
jgi:hypothetical protein